MAPRFVRIYTRFSKPVSIRRSGISSAGTHMRGRGGIVAVLFFLTTALLPPPARAEDRATCKNETGDAAIAGCNRAIASGEYKGHDLGVLFSNRGNAYYDKKDYDRAIADY